MEFLRADSNESYETAIKKFLLTIIGLFYEAVTTELLRDNCYIIFIVHMTELLLNIYLGLLWKGGANFCEEVSTDYFTGQFLRNA